MHASVQWFEDIYRQGTPVTKEDLPEIRVLWLARQAHRPLRDHKRSFLDILLNDTGLLCDRGLMVSIVVMQDAPDKLDKEYRQTLYYDPVTFEALPYYPYFFDAPAGTAKAGDLILSILKSNGTASAEVECEGVWRVQALMPNGFMPVEKVKRPLGFRLPADDERKLAQMCARALRSGKLEVKIETLSLDVFANILLFGE